MCVGLEHDDLLFLELYIFVHALPRLDCDCIANCVKFGCSRPIVSWWQLEARRSGGKILHRCPQRVTKPTANAPSCDPDAV
jgi:hypothetical protein